MIRLECAREQAFPSHRSDMICGPIKIATYNVHGMNGRLDVLWSISAPGRCTSATAEAALQCRTASS